MNKQILIRYLQQLGLSLEEARIYVALFSRGVSTPLTLSRETGINRTKVYRTLEELSAKRFVSEELGEHSKLYSPAPLTRVAELLQEEQKRVAKLSTDFSLAEETLSQMEAGRQSDTKVRYYRGRSGIQQMVWNTLRAKTEIVGYTHVSFESAVGEKFANEYYAEFYRRGLRMRDIYSEEYQRSMQAVDAVTQAYRQNPRWETHLLSRVMPEKTFPVTHQMDIYDDVVSFYRWKDGEIFGVEIYNPYVSQMQKQLFELAWERAKTT